MSIRNTGGVSTLAVINGIRAALPEIQRLLPGSVNVKPIFRSVGIREGGA